MQFRRRVFSIIICAAVLSALTPGASFALEIDDGFGSARVIQGKHFVIYYAPQIDVSALIEKLNMTAADRLLAGQGTNGRGSYESELSGMLDTLFAQVCDTLDMQLYSFQGKIKICPDKERLERIYSGLFRRELPARSFYVYNLNTIYICADNFKPEILAHEIAHAIISHYFVVQPSVRIQEVLAAYVEYQLTRK